MIVSPRPAPFLPLLSGFPMTRLTADLMLLTIALIWGAAFVGQATAMEHMGPLTFTGARFLLAALAVLPFALREAKTGPAIPRGRLPALIGIGIAFFLGCAAQQIALLSTSVTNAGFLTALYVVMVPTFAAIAALIWPGLRAPAALHPAIWPAAVLSLGGTFLLGGSLDGLNRGDALVVFGAVFWAVQILALGALALDLRRPITIALTQYVVTAALGLAAGFIFETPGWDAALMVWRELAYTGIVSGGLAFTLQAIAQAHTPPSDAAILVSTESLFAAAFGALLLGDRLSTSGWFGAALVLVAVLLVQLGPLYYARR